MAHSAERKEQSSDRYVHSVEPGSDEENRTVNVFTSGEFNAVFVLVRLAEKEGNT